MNDPEGRKPDVGAAILSVEQVKELLRGKTMSEVKSVLGPPRDVAGKAWWWSKDQDRFKGVLDPRTERPQDIWVTFHDNDGPVKYFTIGGDMTKQFPGAPLQAGSGPADGFRDLRWGSAPAPDMVSLGDTANGESFTRPSDKLAIGDVPLTAIKYSYLEGRLAVVVVSFDFEVLGQLETFLEGVWGPSLAQPEQPTYWRSDSTTVVQRCSLNGARMENCRLEFASNAALHRVAVDEDARKKREAEEKKKAMEQKAATDL